MHVQDPVDDGYVAAPDLEHNNLADANRVILLVVQEQNVATLERWLHAPAADGNTPGFVNSGASSQASDT